MIRHLIALIALCLLAFGAQSQGLSPQQIGTLRVACAADQACAALANAPSPDDGAIAAWMNTDTETFIVWRTSVTRAELMQDAAFDWTRVDNLSAGKERIWTWMFQEGPINPSKPNVRSGITSTWVGTAADVAVQVAVLAKCKRSATRAQRFLSTGAGTTGNPAVLTWEGQVSQSDASLLR